jgi:hypothetical protein
VAGGFRGHARGGELAQLVIDERQEVGRSLAVAASGSIQEVGHIRHASVFIDYWRQNQVNAGRRAPGATGEYRPVFILLGVAVVFIFLPSVLPPRGEQWPAFNRPVVGERPCG